MNFKLFKIISIIVFLQTSSAFANQLIFPLLKLKYGGVDLSFETSTSRAVRVLVTTCVQDKTTYEPLKFKNFIVETLEKIEGASNNYVSYSALSIEQKFEVTTNSKGCFNFRDVVKHKWYIPERTYIKPFRVTNPRTGEANTLKIAINPWNTSWLFARDYREVNINDLIMSEDKFPEILITNISLDSLGVNYKLDKLLNLSVIKRYSIALTPLVVRHDSLSEGNFGGTYLRDGKYMLVLSITKSNARGIIDKSKFISSIQKIVNVKRGRINDLIEFTIKDLKLMGSRNYLSVELIPTNEDKVSQGIELNNLDHVLNFNSGLKTYTFYGSFVPMLNHQSINLIKSKSESALNISNFGLQNESFQYSNFIKKLDKEKMLSHTQLDEYILEDKKDMYWLTGGNSVNISKISNVLLNSHETQSKKSFIGLNKFLCSLWPKNIINLNLNVKNKKFLIGFYKSCLNFLNNDYLPFNVNKSLFIKSIDNDKLKYLGGTSFNYMVGSNFNLNKSEYSDVRKSHVSDIGFSASIGFDWKIVNFSTKRGETYSSAEGYGKSISNSESLSYGSGAYLVIQKSSFQVPVTKYNKCLIIRPNSNFIKSFLNTKIGSSAEIKNIFINNNINLDGKNGTYRNLIREDTELMLTQKGIIICSDQIFDTPQNIVEDYYYVTQHFLAGDMHDPFSIMNRPWLMSIRSKRDFTSFLSSIKNHNSLTDVGELNYTPIDTLVDSYKEFDSKTPAWPGLYIYPSPDHASKIMLQKRCKADISMFDNLLTSFKEILKGPFQEKDGKNILFKNDFWKIYYCAEK